MPSALAWKAFHMSNELVVQAAEDEDLEVVRRLLEMCALPDAGVGNQWPNAYVVVKEHHQVVASAGLESYGGEGLLRSLAVAPHLRGIGWGARLLHDRLDAAKQLGMRRMFLLTTTAAEFFLN